MSEQVVVEIPIDQFDLSLLPDSAREIGTEAFRDAVVSFFQIELSGLAERIEVLIDSKVIRVAWYPQAEGFDPVEHAIEQLKSGDYRRGVQVLRLFANARPDEVIVNYNLGMALSDLGELDGAIEHLRRALDAEPRDANIHVALGVALYRKRDFNAARLVLEGALELEPDNPYALCNLGVCLLALNEPPTTAVEYLRKATTLLPGDQQAWAGLGQALERQGDIEEADKAFIRAIEINPHNPLAQVAKRGRSRIAQSAMRENVGGGLRVDAVMYCLEALEKCQTMAPSEVQKIAFEIAALGTKGINPNNPDIKHRLRSLPGEFTGLQLLCWMYVAWKAVAPEVDIKFDLSEEYEAALSLLHKKEEKGDSARE
jgi:Flp pilus assembly protein TadD